MEKSIKMRYKINRNYMYLGVILLLWVSMLIIVSQADYPFGGDGPKIWKTSKVMQVEENLRINNSVYPKVPSFEPIGLPGINVVLSNITGLSLDKIYISIPTFLILFFIFSIYILTTHITKNKEISILAAISFFFFFTYNEPYLIFLFMFIKGSWLAISLSLIFFAYLIKRGKKQKSLLIILAGSIGAMHRMTGVIFITILILILGYFLIRRFRKKRKESINNFSIVIGALILIIFIVALVFLPIILNYGIPPSMSNQFRITTEGGIIQDEGKVQNIINSIKGTFITNFFTTHNPLSIGSIILVVFGLIYLFKRKNKVEKQQKVIFLVIIFTLFLGGLLGIRMITEDFQRLFLLPLYCICSGAGIYFIKESFRKKMIKDLFIILVLVLLIISFYINMNSFPYERLNSVEYLNISQGAEKFLKDLKKGSLVIAEERTSYIVTTHFDKEVVRISSGHGGAYASTPYGTYNLTERSEDIKEIYTSCDINKTKEIISKYGLIENTYIYWGLLEKIRYKDICYKKFKEYFASLEFEESTIYYIKRKEAQ